MICLVLVGVAAAILGALGFLTSRENGRRLKRLEEELGDLRRRLGSPGWAPPAPPVAEPATTLVMPEEAAPEEAPAGAEAPLPAALAPSGIDGVPVAAARAVPPVSPTAAQTPAPEVPGREEPPEPFAEPEATPEPVPEPEEPSTEAPRTPPSAPPPAGPRIDWERWIGVRGAALLGAVALALAGFYFLKIAIEQGWIPPAVRVAVAVLAGLGAIVASEVLRRREYEATADALAGAGIVLLYGAFWAARALYGLLSAAVAFGCMALVTVAAGVLSWRYRSRTIALLGLVGGFATPLLLASGEDHPLGLFGYLLLLDAGLLALGRRQGWPWLGLLGVLATAGYQLFWITGPMGPERALLGLGILAVFALLFVVGGAGARGVGEQPVGTWLAARTAAIVLPFLFALYFAARAELGPHLYPLATFLALLTAAALWLALTAADGEAGWLALAAAAADLAVVAVWCIGRPLAGSLAWEAVGCSVGLAAVFHVLAEISSRRHAAAEAGDRPGAGFAVADEATPPETVAAGGFLALLVLLPAAPGAALIWPWLAGWTVLAILLERRAGLTPRRPALQLLAAAGLGLGFGVAFGLRGADPAFPPPVLFFGLAVAVAVVFQLLALLRRGEGLRRAAERAAALLPLLLLASLALGAKLSPGFLLGLALLLALLALLAATRLPAEGWYVGAALLLWLVQAGWTFDFTVRAKVEAAPGTAALALGLEGVAVLLLTAWPFLAGRRFDGEQGPWIVAALAGPAWFLPLKRLFEARFGDAAIGVLPVALGALALAAAFGARRRWPLEDPRRRSALVWFAGVALTFAAFAVPLQLDRSWITVGWALEGVALAALWRRLDHPGLKYFSLLLLAAATLRLVANPAVLGYYPRGGTPVFNWLMYTYLVPAAALLGAAALFGPLEVARLRPGEEGFNPWRRPIAAVGCSAAAILVVFVWINLTIFDAFSTGGQVAVSWERLPARDLTLSLAWGVYALVLLAVGMARNSVALRWVSLAFLLLTIGKVFLYDLGQLKDLYRVASLVGLAASLILVSLAYQRFVFRRRPGGGGEGAGEEGGGG